MNERIVKVAAQAMSRRSRKGGRVTWMELARLALSAADSEATRQMMALLPPIEELERAERLRKARTER